MLGDVENHLEFGFEEIDEAPFEYVFEIREGEKSEMYLSQGEGEGEGEARMVLGLEGEEDWDVFLRNDLFLSLVSLASSVVIGNRVEFTRREVEEILRGSDLKIKWEKRGDAITSSFDRVIVFKEDLLTFKDLF